MIWSMLLWGCSSHHPVAEVSVAETTEQRASLPSLPGVEDWSEDEYRQQLYAIADAAGKKSRAENP